MLWVVLGLWHPVPGGGGGCDCCYFLFCTSVVTQCLQTFICHVFWPLCHESRGRTGELEPAVCFRVSCIYTLEKEMATHSSVLAWRIPETAEPGGLPSVGSHRVGHDWSDLAAAAAFMQNGFEEVLNTGPLLWWFFFYTFICSITYFALFKILDRKHKVGAN